MTKELITKEQLSNEAKDLSIAAGSVVVNDEHTRELAVEFCRQIKSAKERVEEVLGSQVKAAHAAWKTALTIKNRHMEPLERADKVVKSKITQYELEMRRIEREREQEALLQQQKEEEKRLRSLDRKIKNAEKKGDFEKVELLDEERSEVIVPIIPVKPVLGKVKGKSSQKDYDVKVINLKKLLSAILSGDVHIALNKLLTVKTGVIKSFVKSTGIRQIPGCNIQETRIQRIL